MDENVYILRQIGVIVKDRNGKITGVDTYPTWMIYHFGCTREFHAIGGPKMFTTIDDVLDFYQKCEYCTRVGRR